MRVWRCQVHKLLYEDRDFKRPDRFHRRRLGLVVDMGPKKEPRKWGFHAWVGRRIMISQGPQKSWRPRRLDLRFSTWMSARLLCTRSPRYSHRGAYHSCFRMENHAAKFRTNGPNTICPETPRR